MRTILTVLVLVCGIAAKAQLYTPNSTVSATTDPAAGNVGIGTSSPAAKLDIIGHLRAYSHLHIGDGYNSNNRGIWMDAGASTSWDLLNLKNNSGTMFRVQGNGNVGIGTSTPLTKLDLKVSGTNEGILLQTSSRWFRMFAPSLTGGAYNSLTGVNDAGIYFGSFVGVNTVDYNFIIAPHRSEARGMTFTPSGKIGIGKNDPKGHLDVYDVTSNRDYQINRIIPGSTENSAGANYVLLHKIYTNVTLNDSYVIGKISGIRGGTSAWNRKWTVEVNTSSAYQSNRGSMITYNETAKLVTLTYQSEQYMAIEITSNSALGRFSFTGYALNDELAIVYDQDVSGVQDFTSLDPIIINSGNVGIGTTTPGSFKLAVNGKIWTQEVNVAMTNPGPDYVFEPTYNLLPLSEVESYIKANKHLPEVPSAKQMEEEGLNLKEMNLLLLKKVEELTLHLIEMKKENEMQNKKIEELQKK